MVYKKAAVIGYPVSHSLSPKIHQFWLRQNNIDGEYGLLEINPERFEETLKGLKAQHYVGVNVTVPFKERAFHAMDHVEEVAKIMGAVNTVVVKPDGMLWGTNTDGFGFIRNLHAEMPGKKIKRATVLGAGGAARAVVYGLLQEGATEVMITNRTKDRAEALHEIFGSKITVVEWDKKEQALEHIDLLVNTTVLGMEKQPSLEIDLKHLPTEAIVVDIVYKPLITPLLREAKRRGNKTVDGLGMLLYQAVRGFELFFGATPTVTSQLRAEILSS